MDNIETLGGARDRAATGLGGNFYGVYPAIAEDIADPEGQARVKVRLPWADAGGSNAEIWARFATMSAGDESGTFFLPERGDEVLVAFEAGDMRRPYVIGALWNGNRRPPESVSDNESSDVRSISSPSGLRIEMNEAQQRVVIETPGGQRLELSDNNGGRFRYQDGSGVTVTARNGKVTISAPSEVEVSASKVELNAGQVDIQSGLCKVSGVVQCDTLITNSVVSAGYTPGAGNIW